MRSERLRALHALLLLGVLAAGAARAQTGPVVKFAGPVSQDGCPYCCEFSCQQTPTPTPEVDAQGRRVFRRSTGEFLLVVEGGVGTSGRNPGTEGVFSSGAVLTIADPSGKPSVMVLADHNLGNGSLPVDCRTEPLGGVRGFPALDFNGGTDVTTALVDMACRFELASASMFACTRDPFGNFAFISPQTTRQFCFQVSNVSELPLGRTTMAVQLRDTNGNLGPRSEFVVVVDPAATTPTPTRTPTATPTPQAANIAGAVTYYAGSRAVPGATVRASGAATQNATTQGTGAYLLGNLPTGGTVTVEPRKVGDFGSPPAITALDAAYVLQAVAGTRSFDTRQRLAGDVTGNGSLSALDAANILQRQVGLLARFAAAVRCDSDWLFDPLVGASPGIRPITPLLTSTSCRRGAIAYEPLTGDRLQQGFAGVLLGDVTGNWAPASGALRARAAAGGAEVRLRVSRRTADGLLRVPIAVDSSGPYNAVDLTLAIGPGLRPAAVRPLRNAANALLVSNLTAPDRVRIALASGEPLQQGGLLVLDLHADEGAAPDVQLLRALVDDQPALATTGASRVQ